LTICMTRVNDQPSAALQPVGQYRGGQKRAGNCDLPLGVHAAGFPAAGQPAVLPLEEMLRASCKMGRAGAITQPGAVGCLAILISAAKGPGGGGRILWSQPFAQVRRLERPEALALPLLAGQARPRLGTNLITLRTNCADGGRDTAKDWRLPVASRHRSRRGKCLP
jgi:hypothetical protein